MTVGRSKRRSLLTLTFIDNIISFKVNFPWCKTRHLFNQFNRLSHQRNQHLLGYKTQWHYSRKKNLVNRQIILKQIETEKEHREFGNWSLGLNKKATTVTKQISELWEK